MRRFSSYGPVNSRVHFCVERRALVAIWAPRQTGKTWLKRRAVEEIRARYGHRERAGVIEVKSFTQRSDLPSQKAQAGGYANRRGLESATLALFVPTDDEELLRTLSGQEVLEGIVVTTVAISAV